MYPELKELTGAGGKLLVHQEELGDRLCGLMAGYLLYDDLVDTGPKAISVIEQITQRQLGPVGRELVSVALGL